jgi:hypothetical protein
MACLNSKASSNMMIFNVDLVLIKVLCFQGGKNGRRFALTKGCEEINMSLHGSNPIKFIIFYQALFQNKKLLDTFFNV